MLLVDDNFEDGRAACREGRPRSSPYLCGSEADRAWEAGWDRAAADGQRLDRLREHLAEARRRADQSAESGSADGPTVLCIGHMIEVLAGLLEGEVAR